MIQQQLQYDLVHSENPDRNINSVHRYLNEKQFEKQKIKVRITNSAAAATNIINISISNKSDDSIIIYKIMLMVMVIR